MSYAIGRTIKFLRNGYQLTQADLAESLGVSSTQIMKIETGRAELKHSKMKQLAATFNLSVREFYTLVEKIENPAKIFKRLVG